MTPPLTRTPNEQDWAGAVTPGDWATALYLMNHVISTDILAEALAQARAQGQQDERDRGCKIALNAKSNVRRHDLPYLAGFLDASNMIELAIRSGEGRKETR